MMGRGITLVLIRTQHAAMELERGRLPREHWNQAGSLDPGCLENE